MKKSDILKLVEKTQTGAPPDLALYADDVYDIGGTVQAAHRLAKGERIKIGIFNRPEVNEYAPVELLVLKVAKISGLPALRVCGKNETPTGADSWSAIASGYGATDPVRIAAWIACYCTRNGSEWFLLRNTVKSLTE